MGFPTKDQKKAIDVKDRDILVSAAAGSGKTAVLVERIIRIICDEENPVDIDRLLVVTFTNAAAAQMREKISNALTEMLAQNPDNTNLQRQSALLHNAQITTIDSFCLFVIRNNFNDIGLDPGFRIADEGELKLLQSDVMAELMEECFAAGEEAFFTCLESLNQSGNEKALGECINGLYRFAMSSPWPEEWLQNALGAYTESEKKDMWLEYAETDIKNTLEACIEKYKEVLALCSENDGPYMYAELLENEETQIGQLLKAEGFWKISKAMQNITFDRLPSKKDDSVAPDKRELAKEIRNEIKDIIGKIKTRYFFTDEKTYEEDIRSCEGMLEELISLTLSFKEKLDAKKREKNLIDFGDMEHFALQILLEKTEMGNRPTKAAKEYRSHFYEILIDEYQDSNMVQELLLQSISGEDEGKYNRFMVGDVKQSIYKFRLAKPEIFMKKLEYYLPEDEKTQRIDLQQNFRSREEIICCVNDIFEQIMGEKLGKVLYDQRAALYPGADYPDNPEAKTEFLFLQQDEESDKSKAEQEAAMIAKRIRRLTEEHLVTDAKTGKLRPAKYGDIAILLRSDSGWEDALKKELDQAGIPAYAASSTGYFSSEEIHVVMNFLRIVDNPLQDIPLFGVMKSPIGKMDEKEIAGLRALVQKGHLYDAMKKYISDGFEDELAEKTKQLLSLIEKYRKMTVYTPVRKLIRSLLQETGFMQYAAAFSGGRQKQANLHMLLEKAADFEKTSYYGLFHFIRYMEQLEKYDVDFGEAGTEDEQADVVRIMSIHKSKGLEFPVCIVAGLSKQFNRQDTTKQVLMDEELGIGCEMADPVRRIRRNTIRKNVIARKLQLDSLGEELRILYVAMTRAREKMILTGTLKDVGKAVMRLIPFLISERKEISYTELTGVNSLLDFLLPAMVRHPAFEEICLKLNIPWRMAEIWRKEGTGPASETKVHCECVLPEDLHTEEIKRSVSGQMKQLRLEEYQKEPIRQDWYEMFQERFKFTYPAEVLSELYTKTTVSELKMEKMTESSEAAAKMFEEREKEAYIPRFISTKEMSGSSRGSAYHRVMELLDLQRFSLVGDVLSWESEIREQIDRMVMEEKMPPEYADCISEKKIAELLQSPLGEKMILAQKNNCLHREQPFVLGIPANLVKEAFPNEETVLIQGIIDVYWEEEDGVVVADYKTDQVKEEKELVNRYRSQLEYYSRALNQLTDRPVKASLIYSFCLGKLISI